MLSFLSIHEIFKIEFFFSEEYNYPPASVYKFQWYHGTLDRTESNQILRQFAKSLVERHKNDANAEGETSEYSSSGSDDKSQVR